MYQPPSRRRAKKQIAKPNLIPILDAVFIFIFFLLMSANFIKLFEINSDVPIVSDAEPPKNDKPLALTLKITDQGLKLYSGVPSKYLRTFRKNSAGEYDLPGLKDYLIRIKKSNPAEKSIIFEPILDVEYEKLVSIMDAVRVLEDIDDPIYYKDKDGMDVKVKNLFANIIFGNIQS